jgi:hypothetical protein
MVHVCRIEAATRDARRLCGSTLVAVWLVACGDGASSPPDAAVPDAAVPDAAVPDADGSTRQDVARGSCVERNGAAEVTARDGFVEVCADADRHPRAVCGDGSPYRFSYRPAAGRSAGLLVYFRGGGNCTDYISCWGVDGVGGAGRRVSALTNETSSPELLPSLRRTFGLFDRVDPTALFPNFDVVYAPYCTGDGGLASREEVLVRPATASPTAPPTITTYFHGADNRRAVIDWASSRYRAPARLVVWGSSAGAYAAMGAIPELAEAFASVGDVTYWGEGGVGLGRASNATTTDETLARFDGQAGRRLIRFVQFSFVSDATQIDYAPPPIMGDEAMFRAELRRVLEARAARFPSNYRYVAVPGACHTLAMQPALYQAFRMTAGAWAPVTPTVRPNPALVFGGASLVDLVRAVTQGSGPFDAATRNLAPSWDASTDCPLPGR